MWDSPFGRQAGPALELRPDTLARFATYDRLVHDALPTTPHWYLGVLATHPDAAGHGYGRATMRAGLVAAAGTPAYLETSNPANVDLYTRAGWQTVAHRQVDTLPVWFMRQLSAPMRDDDVVGQIG